MRMNADKANQPTYLKGMNCGLVVSSDRMHKFVLCEQKGLSGKR